jgi:hypothetical protein
VPVILPLERNLAVFVREEPVIGYGDAVRVAAEVFDRLLRATEWRFCIHDPVGFAQRGQISAEGGSVVERLEVAEECEFAVFKSLVERFEEQAAEQAGQNAHGKKEARQAGDPALVVRRKTTAGNDAVQMGMVQQILPPGVQHGEKADAGFFRGLQFCPPFLKSPTSSFFLVSTEITGCRSRMYSCALICSNCALRSAVQLIFAALDGRLAIDAVERICAVILQREPCGRL